MLYLFPVSFKKLKVPWLENFYIIKHFIVKLSSGTGQARKGKERHLRVIIGHPRVTVGRPRVTMGHLRLIIGSVWRGTTIDCRKPTQFERVFFFKIFFASNGKNN